MSNNKDINDRLVYLEKTLEKSLSTLQEIICNNKNLKKQIEELTDDREDLCETIYHLENQMTDLNQYSRRENIEIQNIPETVLQKDLEQYVISMLSSIGVSIDSYGLVAVHRLGKSKQPHKSRNVIVRFINRNNAFISLRSAKKLAGAQNTEYRKLFITENLCPTNKNIFNRLYKLKKEKSIDNVWTYEGRIYCKISDRSNEHPINIKHPDDIEYYCSGASLSTQ